MSTAACESAITYLDGDAGILRYRGYPIEQLAENSTYLEVAYLLLNGELPNAEQFDDLAPRRHVPHVHPRERPQALPRGLPLRRPPDGHAGLRRRRPLDLLPRRQGHLRPRVPQQADHPAHRQDADPGRGGPPLQRRACPSSTPTTRSTSPRTSSPCSGRWPSPASRPTPSWPGPSTSSSSSTPTTSRTARPPPCGSSARRTPTPTRPPPPRRPRSTARATAAPTRPSSAC